MFSYTCPKLLLYAVMISCLCALLLEVIRSKMASLSLPEEHKANFSNTTLTVKNVSDCASAMTAVRPLHLFGQKSRRSEALTDAFHRIVEGLSINAGIKVGSICYCASEHL